ncbi:hypothetical protein ACFWN1_01555 [Streptomyces sp. NPDC058459]|uniref:hypothetical protein n=1 Tax=Streptomyces sp. NPDC058459 TaxID=3346508 RepID=UPI00366793C0
MQYVQWGEPVVPQESPPAPAGTVRTYSPPGDVHIGDFVLLDGQYEQIRDMRSAGTTSSRVLHFVGRPPWIMREPRTVYRPI